MSRPRIHLPPQRLAARVLLEPGERHYLVDVLRLSTGDEIEVFDGQGSTRTARLSREEGGWALELGLPGPATSEQRRVRLGVALLKGRRLDEVVRMATEIGTSTIEPFQSERCVPRPQAGSLANRVARWRQISIDAARQCGRADVPGVAPVRSLAEILASACSAYRAILHEKANGPPLQEFLSQAADGELLLLVGPEGGFSEAEVRLARENGFNEVLLGRSILRADTAAVVAAALACLDRGARGRVRV